MDEYIEREPKCEDCIHTEVCLAQYGTSLKRWVEIDGCKRYKSKADVVEVVRCRDCAYSNEDGTRCHYGVGRDTEPMGYCHKGAKMDGKGEG